MQSLIESYKEHITRGVKALEQGRLSEGRGLLLLAAERLFDIAERTTVVELRTSRLAEAQALLNDIEAISRGGPEKSNPVSAADGNKETTKAKTWELVHSPGVSFDDIAGLNEVKETIRRRVLYPFQNPDAAARYRKRPGGGVLLYGPPGNGKTMIAKAIASELDASFFSIRCSDILSKWVGEAENNIRELFEAAREVDLSVVFFDETEALVGKRGKGSTIMDRLIPEFLAQVDGLDTGGQNILLLGATNRPWDMDEAALRPGRFGDEIIYIGLPDSEARRYILTTGLDGLPGAELLDIDEMIESTDGLSGADLNALLHRISDFPYTREVATGQRESITSGDVQTALLQTRPSVTASMLQRFEKFSATRC